MATPPLPTGMPYGERKRLDEFRRAAPMYEASPLPGPAADGGGSSALPSAAPPGNLFGPTARPDEPITAGIPLGPGPNGPEFLPRDDGMRLRAAYRVAVRNGWDSYADDLAEMIAQGRR